MWDAGLNDLQELIELGGVYKRLVARQLLGSQPQDDATTDNGAS